MKIGINNYPFLIVSLLALLVLYFGTRTFDDTSAESQTNSSIELVMNDGASIEATGHGTMIKISAQGPLKRTYEWNKCSLTTTLTERANRWFGSLGAYDPAASFGIWPGGCEGISRSVVQEGQIHFDDEIFAIEWIRRRPKSYSTAWSAEGLLVSWDLTPPRSQLNVDVWLMCLDGKPFNNESKTSSIKLHATSIAEGHPIRQCVQAGQDAIKETRNQIEESWIEVDALHLNRDNR